MVRPKGLGKGIESLIPIRQNEKTADDEGGVQVAGMGCAASQ